MKKAQANPHTKEKLLDAAQQLMLAKGFGATGVEEICRKAGVTKGSFFHYFKSKEELGKTVLERFCSGSREVLEQSCCHIQEPDPLKRIFKYLETMVEMSRGEAVQGCLIGAFAQELSDTNPGIRSLCAQAFEEWSRVLKDDLEAARVKYAPRKRLDTRSLAEYFIAVLEGAQILARAKKDRKVIERSAAHLKKYLENLFNPPKKETVHGR